MVLCVGLGFSDTFQLVWWFFSLLFDYTLSSMILMLLFTLSYASFLMCMSFVSLSYGNLCSYLIFTTYLLVFILLFGSSCVSLFNSPCSIFCYSLIFMGSYWSLYCCSNHLIYLFRFSYDLYNSVCFLCVAAQIVLCVSSSFCIISMALLVSYICMSSLAFV